MEVKSTLQSGPGSASPSILTSGSQPGAKPTFNRFDHLSEGVSNKKRLLACYLPFDDPAMFEGVEQIYSDCGVDVIEYGLPCANPYSDGAIVANSMKRAFAHNPSIEGLGDRLAELRETMSDTAIALMGYEENMTIPELLGDVGSSLDGILCLGQRLATERVWRRAGKDIYNICFVSHASTEAEVIIAAKSKGYIMQQAVDGVTGAREILQDNSEQIARIKATGTQTPVLLGFGVSSVQHVSEAIAMGADGVVIGSKCIDIAVNQGAAALEKFLKDVRGVLDAR